MTTLRNKGVEHPMQDKSVAEKACQTNLERYGHRNGNVKKSNETKLQRYGDIFGANAKEKRKAKQDSTTAKIQATNIARYGVAAQFSRPEIVAKAQETCLQRYGHRNGNVEQIIATKRLKYKNGSYDVDEHKVRMIDKYGSLQNFYHERAMLSAKTRNYAAIVDKRRQQFNGVGTNIEQMHATTLERYGVDWSCQLKQCINAQSKTITSINKHWHDIIEQATGISMSFEHSIEDKRYDLRWHDLLIEVNPSITHNTTYSYQFWRGLTQNNKPMSIDYHANKQRIATNNSYRCIHIWPWDDEQKTLNFIANEVCSMQNKQQVIYARQAYVTAIELKHAKEFQQLYHLQGSLHSQQVCLGLWHAGKLVQVMTFGNIRFGKQSKESDCYELLRLCSSNCIVVGGAQKLFKYFVRHWKPRYIKSYCDLSKFEGTIYGLLGFKLANVSLGMHYVKAYNDKSGQPYHVTANALRMQGADRLLGTSYGKGTDNHSIMLANNYVTMFDCGQATYVWHAKHD